MNGKTCLRTFLFLICVSVCSLGFSKPPELIVYTYDSLLGEKGFGTEIFPLFEKKFHCRIRPLSWGDGGQISTRLKTDVLRKKTVAHLVFGIDQHQWEMIKPFSVEWDSWRPLHFDQILEHTRIENGFLPFDYSYMAMMVDEEQIQRSRLPEPRSLSDLLQPIWKKNILIEDPRTSNPGLGFLLYTYAILGDSVWNFWASFRSQWLTLAPGWDSAYRLFLKGEAPLVWSYLTSQAYHEENPSSLDKKSRYKAVLFKEGQPLQVEGAALIRGDYTAQEKELAKKFLEFLISNEVQEKIPKTNWMLPVRKGVQVPESFAKLPKPQKTIFVRPTLRESRAILDEWSRSLVSPRAQ